jgi:hypothetical protein
MKLTNIFPFGHREFVVALQKNQPLPGQREDGILAAYLVDVT